MVTDELIEQVARALYVTDGNPDDCWEFAREEPTQYAEDGISKSEFRDFAAAAIAIIVERCAQVVEERGRVIRGAVQPDRTAAAIRALSHTKHGGTHDQG